jgi:hypothetical protein
VSGADPAEDVPKARWRRGGDRKSGLWGVGGARGTVRGAGGVFKLLVELERKLNERLESEHQINNILSLWHLRPGRSRTRKRGSLRRLRRSVGRRSRNGLPLVMV